MKQQQALAIVQDELALDPVVESQLAPSAERIRGLVEVTRGCIIEIGRELRLAKEKVGHGHFIVWVRVTFGWSRATAWRYMEVEEAFGKCLTVKHLGDLTIDASALYLLSRDTMPQAIRDEAVERAEAGEHITLEAAEKLIAERVAQALTDMRERLTDKEEEVSSLEDRNLQLCDEVESLKGHLASLKDELAEREPTAEDAAEIIRKITGKKKLSDRQMQGLALALGTPITDGNKSFPPATPEESEKATGDLRIAAPFMQVLEYFQTAPKPAVVFAALRPFMLPTMRRNLPIALDWLKRFAEEIERRR